MDFVAAEAYLRKLLKLSPAHNAGTLQLARLLSEVHFSRANVAVTPELEATMDEICDLFEKSIAATKDVSCYSHIIYYWHFVHTYLRFLNIQPTYVLAEYLKLVERSATNKRKVSPSSLFRFGNVSPLMRHSCSTAEDDRQHGRRRGHASEGRESSSRHSGGDPHGGRQRSEVDSRKSEKQHNEIATVLLSVLLKK